MILGGGDRGAAAQQQHGCTDHSKFHTAIDSILVRIDINFHIYIGEFIHCGRGVMDRVNSSRRSSSAVRLAIVVSISACCLAIVLRTFDLH